MGDIVDSVNEGSEKNIKVELNLLLEVKDGKVNSRISFKQMEGVSLETMQIIGRKIQALKRSLDGVFATDDVNEETHEEESPADDMQQEENG